MRRRSVHIIISENFYNQFENLRKEYEKKIGLKKKLSGVKFSELLVPKVKIRFPNVQGKKSRRI